MNFEMQKALMLAENIYGFIKFVHKSYEDKNSFRFHLDKLYQVKLLIEEYKFQLIADELWRINQFEWDAKYSYLLVDWFVKGFNVIEEYVTIHTNELFLLETRLYTLKNLSLSFNNGK